MSLLSTMYNIFLLLLSAACLKLWKYRYSLFPLLLLSALYEIVYGIMQIYNVTYVRHRIYPLTGTFFNPGPYAGWLAAILPLCIYYTFYFQKKKAINKLYGGGYIIVSCTTLLIICLLPATMSRTAWCAAIISSIFVLLCEENIRKRCTTYLLLLKHKKWLSFILIIILQFKP